MLLTNRDVFIKEYLEVIKAKHPELSDGILNDCSHGCLIAVNSNLGLSDEAHEAGRRLGLANEGEIIKYVFLKPVDIQNGS